MERKARVHAAAIEEGARFAFRIPRKSVDIITFLLRELTLP